MAKQSINLGTSANKGDGDPLRTAFDKINDNFNELYAGNNVDPANTAANLIPDVDGTRDLGSSTKRWGDLYVRDFIYLNGNRIEVTAGGALLVNGGAAAEVQDAVGSVFADDSTLLVDGVNSLIPSSVVSGTEATNWNTAYGWGDHSVVGYLTSVPAQTFVSLTGKPTTLAGYGISDAQDALVSGTSIKTINGESLLGSGNIAISGGGSAFTNIGIGADDSTIRNISEGESFLILGGTGITTASDAEGNITITGVAQDFTFSSLTGTPTTLAGYGITDAATLNNIAPTGAVDFTGAISVDFTGATVTGLSVSGLQSRGSVTGTTGSLADAAEADLDITGFKSYALLTITTDRAARVRLYVTAATRTADASRAEGVDPTSDAGLIAEVITTGAETVIISPGAYGFNLESSPTTTIPCRVTNKSGGTSTVQVDLNLVQLEA